MPKNRKLFVHKQVVLITTRMEEGLPLVPNELINTILLSILARARSMYDLKICHFVFMANHMHLLVVVDNPEHLPLFMRYLKTESAHAVNKLLGREQKTIWSSGYDSPAILTFEDTLRYISYIYTNPQKANLVESIDEYPGISSWKMFLEDQETLVCPKIRRETIICLNKKKSLSKSEAQAVLDEILEKNEGSQELRLEPYAFLECFPEGLKFSKERVKKLIIEDVRRKERSFSQSRKTPVLGVTKLVHQPMEIQYQPKARGRRMICISSDKDQRNSYIDWFKSVCMSARSAYKTMLEVGSYCIFPASVFLPGGGIHANLNPSFLLC